MNNYQIIGKPNCLLGEGVYWDAFSRTVKQLDIEASEFLTVTLGEDGYAVEQLPQKGACMAQFEDGSFLFGMEDGVYTARGARIAKRDPSSGIRFNDGKVGPDGYFYLGTIEKGGNGALYRLKNGTLETVVSGVRISNGIDFSIDGKTVYYCDTAERKIEAFDFPSFENRHTVFALDDTTVGYPDGMCIDSEGMLWSALWGGGCVVRIDPDKGKIIDKIDLSATYTSCPAFVGEDLSLLAVTSAKHDKDLADEPHAGCTFLLDVGVRGRAPYLCKKQNAIARKVALVTGAGTGIGKDIAYELARAGYDVAVHCHGSTEGAIAVAERIQKDFGRKTAVIRSNLANLDGVKALFSEFLTHFDRLDLFVNNAGVTKKSEFLETEEELFDLIVNVDYKGAYFCMQNAARIMAERKIHGSIVLISSNNAKAHFADVSVYGSAKAAIQKAAEHMAIELAKYRIRVNTVAPGWTETGAARLDAKESTYYKVPLGRWAQTNEIAHAVLYLSDDMADSITGTTLVIDGGALLVSDKAERYGFYHS